MAFRVSHQRDAERALAEMVDAVNRGSYVPKTRQTVSGFAAEWLAAIEPTVRRAPITTTAGMCGCMLCRISGRRC